MLNMIRMELYRMFKTKSLYVIWLVLAAGILFTTGLSADEMKTYTMEEKQEMYEYATGQNREIRFQYLTCFMEISKESFSHFLW